MPGYDKRFSSHYVKVKLTYVRNKLYEPLFKWTNENIFEVNLWLIQVFTRITTLSWLRFLIVLHVVVVVVVATTPQWSGTEGVDSTMWRFRRHV